MSHVFFEEVRTLNKTLASELKNQNLFSDGKNLSANLLLLGLQGSQHALYILIAFEPF